MNLRRLLVVAAASAALIVAASEPVSAAESEVETGFTAWSLWGDHTLTKGGSDNVSSLPVDQCPVIDEHLEIYETARPWEDEDSDWPVVFGTFGISTGEEAKLKEWYEANGYTWDFPSFWVWFCGTVHEDGYLPARDQDAEEQPNPWVTITLTGYPKSECPPGQILMIRSGYFYLGGTWHSYRGTGWTEDYYGGGLPTVSGTYEFTCVSVFTGPDDFQYVADAVPTAQVNVNPALQGLTGLDHWFWYDFSLPASYGLGPLTISGIPGAGTTWTMVMEAWVDSVHWDIDCVVNCTFRGDLADFDLTGYEYSLDLPDTSEAPATVYEGGAGEEGLAAAIHLYEEKGDFTLSTAAVWRGRFTLFGISYEYEPVVVAEASGYEVIEIRSVLGDLPDS